MRCATPSNPEVLIHRASRKPLFGFCLAAATTLALTACGGGGGATQPSQVSVDATTGAAGSGSDAAAATTATFVKPTPGAPAALSIPDSVVLLPQYHMLPVQLDEPSEIDADGSETSAHLPPHRQEIPAAVARIDTTRLTPKALATFAQRATAQGTSTPESATPSAAAYYTPAQIRAAYGLPALSAGSAALGGGQTIYIVDAQDNPTAFSDLNAFSAKFGLPACTLVGVAPSAKLPLAKPPASSCTFSKVYSTTGAKMTATVPAFDEGWQSEIALDVQWAHAIAPLARIVLIESADPSGNGLLGAIGLANAMGPGVVSMSFGGDEGSWMASVDATFTATGMTYLAATGDSGAAMSWPSASSNVLAVGGTSLTYTGSGPRSETAWSGTGGGISAYVVAPAYQSGLSVPGAASLAMRGAADVAFNADPNTGVPVAISPRGKTTPSYWEYGGTSLATPQWAGVVALANAARAQRGLATLGAAQPVLYGGIGKSPGTYASAFADVTSGRDGSCATCGAGVGFDLPTGWGTPNVSAILPALASMSTPVVPGGTLTTRAGAALSASLGVDQSTTGTLSFSLSDAPAGMTVNGSGVVAWAAPVQGSYTFTATARDIFGLSGSGSYSVTVTQANRPPVVASATLTAQTGTAFAAQAVASDPDGDALSFKMSGAPAGLTMTASGAMSWSKPVKGTYTLKLSVTDTYQATTTATYTLKVSLPPSTPSVTSKSVSHATGSALSTTMTATNADGLVPSYGLSGAPSGMVISAAGIVGWPKPVAGTYRVVVTARDPSGLTGTGTLVVVIVAPLGTTGH